MSDKNIKYIKEGLSPQEADKKIEFLKYRLEIFYRYSSEEGLKLPRLDEAILLNINSFPKTTNYDSPEITKEKQKSYVYNLFVSNNEIGFANKEEIKSYVNRLNR